MNEKVATKNSAPTPEVPSVLDDPMRNRGVAFSLAEREALGLTGRLPSAVLTLDEQARRAYQQLQAPGRATWPRTYTWNSCTTATRCSTSRCSWTTWPSCCPSSTTQRSGTRSSGTRTSTGGREGIYLSIDRPDDMRDGVRHAGPGAWRRGPDRVQRRRGDPRHRRLGRRRHPDLGRQAGRLHRRGRHRPAPGHPRLPGRRHQQRGAAERPAVPGQPARPGPR